MNDKKFWFTLGGLGCLPALVLLALIRLKEGQLVVAGQTMAEYDLTHLFAALISIYLPLYLVLPLAVGLWRSRQGIFHLTALLAPLALLGPSLLAGVLIGGRNLGLPLAALGLLCLICHGLCHWVWFLRHLLGERLAVILFGLFWAGSAYIDHLRQYILPYLEMSTLNMVGWFNWLLPQLASAPSVVDDLLQSGVLSWRGLGPTLLQWPLLVALRFFLTRGEETA